MKCIDCKNLTRAIDEDGDAFFWCEKISDCPYEDMERDCRHFIRKTNADRLRSMTDEELAFILASPSVEIPPWCVPHLECPHMDKDPVPCDECALDWLRQEARDDQP